MIDINRMKVSIRMCVYEILAGIFLLINPVGFTYNMIVAAGIALVIAGATNLFRYFHSDAERASHENRMKKGILYILFGLFLGIKSEYLISVLPLAVIPYGMVALFSGIYKLQWTVDMMRTKQNDWYMEGIGAVLSIGCAIITFINPFTSVDNLWTFIGASMIVEAALDAGAVFLEFKQEH